MYTKIIDILEKAARPCFYKKYLGIDCPGCGMQRAFIELLKGNLWESIKTFPALIPLMIMLVYLVLHLTYKFKKGAYNLTIMFIFTTAIIVISFIFKIINQ